MLQALLSSVSGIQAQQTRMNVIGNNLANLNTTGYKSSDVSFDDMMSQTLQGAQGPTGSLGGTDPQQVGLGAVVGATTVETTQGSLEATNIPSNLAIQGNGYFMVSNGSQVSYSRDGTFTLDSKGDLVQQSTGQLVVGYPAVNGAVNTGSAPTAASTLNIPLGEEIAGQATSNVTLSGNLNSASTAAQNWSTQTTVYDAQGAAQTITIEFQKAAVQPATGSTWDWTAYQGAGTTGTVLGSSTSTGNATLQFNTAGALSNPSALGAISVPGSNGSAATAVKLNFAGVSQLSTTSNASVTNQNGVAPGTLQSYAIGTDGTITGTFSNGLTQTLGQVALAQFSNPSGLLKQGNNLLQATANSGTPQVGTAGANGLGSVNAGYLEQSNVDLTTQFSNMIISQSAFQANTKVVTTVDQMLQEVMQMKQ